MSTPPTTPPAPQPLQGVIYGDASHVVGPALPLLVPSDEVNDSFVQCRKSRIDKAIALASSLKTMSFDWQNVSVASAAFGAGAMLSAWLSGLDLGTEKGAIVYIGGAVLFTAGLVLMWATHKFRSKSVAQIADDILELLPNNLTAPK